jgi:hypothetical protein
MDLSPGSVTVPFTEFAGATSFLDTAGFYHAALRWLGDGTFSSPSETPRAANRIMKYRKISQRDSNHDAQWAH